MFPEEVFQFEPQDLKTKVPLFVTWMKAADDSLSEEELAELDPLDESQWDLRGCIGTFAPEALHTTLPTYALTAALKDTRFAPISPSELVYLRCSVSLLSEFEETSHNFDWEVGKHGIYMIYQDPTTGKVCRGTFLPEVAKEQGWDHAQTLSALLRKAGYRGLYSRTMESRMTVLRYTSSKAHITFHQFKTLYLKKLQELKASKGKPEEKALG